MILTATINGRRHHLRRENGQDAAFGAAVTKQIQFGLVLDGCGSKYTPREGRKTAHSEVGARLLGRFLADYLYSHLPKTGPKESVQLLSRLHAAGLEFLRSLLSLFPFSSPEDEEAFIYGHLLATVVGFVRWEETAVFFWRGDGCLLLDDVVICCDANNQPDYLAYDLFTAPPTAGSFHLLSPRTPAHRLAVATDGWQTEQLAVLPPLTTNLQLGRLLNQQARDRRYFDDDGAIAIWQQNEEPS